MSDTTDAVVGTVGGLIALGVLANVAGNVLRGPRRARAKPLKPLKFKAVKKKKVKKMTW